MRRSETEDGPSKKRRICKLGAGVEQTYNKADTPGFQLRTDTAIVKDIRGFSRLELPRNNKRLIQSSAFLLQSWRANCDVQILLYETDPLHPDPSEIAKATDYIVAYACKGVETLQEERNQMVSLVMAAHETFGDHTDVQRLARQLLNKTIGEKMISKQEAMVLVGQLRLVHCSESIDTVSISGYYKLDKNSTSTTFLKKYATRDAQDRHLTIHQFFHKKKNNTSVPASTHTKYIPHYVGASSQPTFPPSVPFARSMVLLHTPWRQRFDDNQDFVTLFHDLIESTDCPSFLKIPYLRIKARVLQKKIFLEPTNTADDIMSPFLSTAVSDDLKEIIKLAHMRPPNASLDVSGDEFTFDKGKDYDWSVPHYKVSTS